MLTDENQRHKSPFTFSDQKSHDIRLKIHPQIPLLRTDLHTYTLDKGLFLEGMGGK